MGTVIIQGGGALATGAVTLGASGEFSQGIVTVTGVNSLWNSSGQLVIGDGSIGTLTVQNGGAAASIGASIGGSAFGVGNVTITGLGSRWNTGGLLIVGDLGTGTLTAPAGGAVTTWER